MRCLRVLVVSFCLIAAVSPRAGAIYATHPPYLFRENVGLLDMMVTNVGVFGNPGFTDGYGAEWRGNEYLYGAGLWIGAIASDNLPYVSTALFEYELRPSLDAVDTIYPSYEGAPGGNRNGFSANPDDDADGLIDEETLNGKDDDHDGRVDEDYAAISNQMLSCEYWDYTPEAQNAYPDHRPLNILVRQRTLGWSTDGINEFIAVEFEISNVGFELLRQVYLGFMVDCDAGPRDHPSYYADDGGAFVSIDTTLVDHSLGSCNELPVHAEMLYMYDIPDDSGGSGGDAEGFFGLLLLGHTTDPTGREAPLRVGVHTARIWNGALAYPAGDPSNDFERYDLLASGVISRRPTGTPGDYRFGISTGPFGEFAPGETLTLQLAFVIGEGFFDSATWTPHPELGHDGTPSEHSLLANALRARLVYQGRWKDLDGNPLTGVDGKETCIATDQGQPYEWHDPCDPTHVITFDGSVCSDPMSWVDNDCDPCTPNPAHEGCGGSGCETLVHWYALPALAGTDDGAGTDRRLSLQLEPLTNPTSTPARFRVRSASPGPCVMKILDVAGRQVREVRVTLGGAGTHELFWDGRDDEGRSVAAGIYWIRVTTAEGSANRRLTVLR